MPAAGQFEPLLTGLFEATWRPRKAATVLWRRVETISPDAYAQLIEWARASAAGLPLRWLEAMATNEASIEPLPALAELDALALVPPPPPIAETLTLLRDLIWEASDPNSDWLLWRPCRVCGRRWSTMSLEHVVLCPLHATPSVLIELLSAEMATYGELADHQATIDRLRQSPPSPARPPALDAPSLMDVPLNGNHEDDVAGLTAAPFETAAPPAVELAEQPAAAPDQPSGDADTEAVPSHSAPE